MGVVGVGVGWKDWDDLWKSYKSFKIYCTRQVRNGYISFIQRVD